MRFGFFAAAAAIALMLASAQAAPTRVDDPVKFVKSVYATMGKKPEPDDFYSARLNALIALDKKEAGGEVGRYDFDFWINAQDGSVSGLTVSKMPVDNAPDRMIVVAKFKNYTTPNEIHFYFEKTAAGWKLDDVRSLVGDTWVLSLMLKYGSDSSP
jgi:hypothetical protein